MSIKRSCYLIVFIIIALAGFLSANFSGLELPDTNSYIDVAKLGFASQYVSVRPALYPLLIYFASIFSEEHINAIIVTIQVLFYLGSALFLIWMLLKVKVQTRSTYFIIAIVIIVAFLNPQSLHYNSAILPENICLLFILISAYFISKESSTWKFATLTGCILVIPMLFKPVWISLIILPLFFNLKNFKNSRVIRFLVLLPIFISVSLFAAHQWM